MGADAKKPPPIPANEANLLAGVNVYRTHCDVCHGLPQHKPTAIASGMFPRPPALFSGKGVTDDPPGETYWKVANGIRLSGMPGFSGKLTSDEMWQVSLLLAHANELPDRVRSALH
jgi:mono/diheme cytochrome c family protein